MLGEVSGIIAAIAALVTALGGLFGGYKWGKSSATKQVQDLQIRDERTTGDPLEATTHERQ